MKVTLIWAEGHNRAIGRNNTLAWHVPEDFQHFKAVTAGRPVLMGRKTWDSLPRKPLPGRTNLVVSQSLSGAPGAEVFRSIDSALEAAVTRGYPKLVVIGGAQIYAHFVDRADEIWITHIDQPVPDADAFAPELDRRQWRATQVRYLSPLASAVLYERRAART